MEETAKPVELQQTKKEQKNPNDLLVTWINVISFKDDDRTRLLLKLQKNQEYLNGRFLIKTNDYKLENGIVTITGQIPLNGLKDMNKFSYSAVKQITEHIKEKEEKLIKREEI